MKLTQGQIDVLSRLNSMSPANIPAIHAGKLAAAGYVEKTGVASGQRGYANVSITEAGAAAIA